MSTNAESARWASPQNRKTLAPGERVNFDVVMMDAKSAVSSPRIIDPQTFESPSAKAQREITDDAERTAAARKYANDVLVQKAVDQLAADRAAHSPVSAALRNARWTGTHDAGFVHAASEPANNVAVRDAIRSARYL